ncbi:MAG: DUF502 domain-containing protein [Candidatus Auribacterota bacterium]|jgi:uncharacterized membrane protein|nr:DUF502 domain-containing protein [Candidatus Auribacterota bacterium]
MFLRRMRNYLITGVIIVLPIFVSVYVFSFLFIKLTDYIFRLFPKITLSKLEANILFRVIALAILLNGLILIGMFGRNVIGKKMLYFGESIILKIPLIGKVYVAVKQLSEAFLGFDRNILSKVCLIEYPRKGLHSIGFITSHAGGEVQHRTKQDVCSVFVPTTPNPTSGVLVMVPDSDIIPLQMSIEDGLKLVISGGAVVPPFDPEKYTKPTLDDVKEPKIVNTSSVPEQGQKLTET